MYDKLDLTDVLVMSHLLIFPDTQVHIFDILVILVLLDVIDMLCTLYYNYWMLHIHDKLDIPNMHYVLDIFDIFVNKSYSLGKFGA